MERPERAAKSVASPDCLQDFLAFLNPNGPNGVVFPAASQDGLQEEFG